jgi:predicted nucleic acid-binding protein
VVTLLDSAAIAAFLDPGDGLHASADAYVRSIAGRHALTASVVTYAELLTGAELGHHDGGVVRGFFAELIDEVFDVTRPVAERAARLRSTTRLKMPDALILATADVRDTDTVVTGDRRWRDAGIAARVEVLTE